MQNKRDIIYIEKELLKDISKNILIVILAVMFVASVNILLGRKIIILINIILIFSILFLGLVTFSFSENKFLILSSLFYIIIGIFKVIELVGIEKFIILGTKKIFRVSLIMEAIYIFSITSYLVYTYLNNKKKRLKIIFIYSVVILLATYFIFFSTNNRYYYRFLVIIVFLKAIFNILKFPFISEKKVNYLIIVSIGLFIASIFSFMEIVYIDNFAVFSFFAEILSFISYTVIHLSLNYKLLRKPSENLFTELHNRNEYLTKINQNIDIKNKNLEKIQQKLKIQEAMFKNIYSNIQVPLVIVTNNERILYANSKFKDIVNIYDFKKIINKNILSFLDVSNIKVLYDDKNIKNFLEYVKIKDSNKIYNVSIIETEKGNNILIFYDVTEEIKMNKIKKEFEKKSLEEKIKNDFLSNISHDIKTPINVIYSAIQLQSILIKEHKLEEIKKYNNLNKRNIISITRLTNNLIDSSKLSNNYLKANMEILNIVELVEDNCERLVDYIKNKGLNFYFDTEEEEIYINCDRDFMERIIVNIISNAIKYTTEGEISVKINIDNDKVLIEFNDTGEGISEELLETIFEKYVIGNNEQQDLNKSTGIGLYVVKNLIKLQNGNITINSKKNIGTTIILEFLLENNNGDFKDDIL